MIFTAITIRNFLLAIVALLVAGGALANHREGHVDVTVGVLSNQAQFGQQVFNAKCADCHGLNGSGTRKGPPLIHAIYNPGHHSNKSFYRAVRNGVKQHHWPYGDMPPQKSVGFSEMGALVKFIREVQVFNGIETEKHRM